MLGFENLQNEPLPSLPIGFLPLSRPKNTLEHFLNRIYILIHMYTPRTISPLHTHARPRT